MTPGSRTQPPSKRTVIPSNTPAKLQQTADLITHIAKADNHLWQALTSLQNQVNSVVNNITDWTRWNPKFYDSTNRPLANRQMSAYYMVIGPVLLLNVYGLLDILDVPDIRFDLPIDVGETIIKTCSAYLFSPTILSEGNGVAIVRLQKQLFMMYIKPTFYNKTDCDFAASGTIGIIQDPGTEPPVPDHQV